MSFRGGGRNLWVRDSNGQTEILHSVASGCTATGTKPKGNSSLCQRTASGAVEARAPRQEVAMGRKKQEVPRSTGGLRYSTGTNPQNYQPQVRWGPQHRNFQVGGKHLKACHPHPYGRPCDVFLVPQHQPVGHQNRVPMRRYGANDAVGLQRPDWSLEALSRPACPMSLQPFVTSCELTHALTVAGRILKDPHVPSPSLEKPHLLLNCSPKNKCQILRQGLPRARAYISC